MNVIRVIIIAFLFSALLFWANGYFPKVGEISHTVLGVFIFISLVINCYAGVLSLKGDVHKEKINKITLFTVLTFMTFPLFIYVIELALKGESIIDLYVR